MVPVLSYSQLTITGTYQGRNLYVRNPCIDRFCDTLCTDSVTVNGKRVEVEHKTAYEIYLSKTALQKGDSTEVVIHYKTDCIPKILNPEGIGLYEHVNDSTTGIIRWTNKSIPNKKVYLEEQSEVRFCSIGRRKMIDSIKVVENSNLSKNETVYTDENYFYDIKKEQIIFSKEVEMELYSSFGNLISRSKGKILNVSDLKKGTYYFLNFDNRCVKITKLK